MHKPNEKKATRACVDAKWAELEAAAERAPRPTAKQRRAAAELCAPVEIRGEVPPWGVGALLVALPVLAIVLMLLVAGCVPMEAVQQCELEAAVNHGHACDAALTSESRAIGHANERAWRAQHRALVGEDVPQAVREGWAPLDPEAR